MKRKIAAVLLGALMALAVAAPASADNPHPPGFYQQGGQGGYEGQPGNQSNG